MSVTVSSRYCEQTETTTTRVYRDGALCATVSWRPGQGPLVYDACGNLRDGELEAFALDATGFEPRQAPVGTVATLLEPEDAEAELVAWMTELRNAR
jgi:hypothetical protein